MALPIVQTDANELPVPLPARARSSFVKAGISLITTANVDMLIAFSTGYWATWNKQSTHEHGGYGLWKVWTCSDRPSVTESSLHQQTVCSERLADLSFPAWYVTTQVLMTLALGGFLAAAMLLLTYMFLPGCQRSRGLMSSLIAISYSSGFFLIGGLIVFGVKVAEEVEERSVDDWFLSWSFSLACTAAVLNQIAASLLVTEHKRLLASTHHHGATVSDSKHNHAFPTQPTKS